MPSIETLEKYARALESPLYRFFYEGEEPPKKPKLPPAEKREPLWGASGKEWSELRSLAKALSEWMTATACFCLESLSGWHDKNDKRLANSRMSRKHYIQLFPNIFSVENFHAGNLPGNDIEDEHPLLGQQPHIPVPRAETALWFGAGVKSRARVIAAAATVVDSQRGNLGSQLGSPFSMRSSCSSTASAGCTSVRSSCFSVRWFMETVELSVVSSTAITPK